MPEMILYLLKVNLALILFYAGYHFILQRYTFHNTNRFYLLIGLVYSALYPLIDLSKILNPNGQLKERIEMLAPDWHGPVTFAVRQAENGAGNYWQIVLMIFWTGVIFMSLRLLIQLASLLILHIQSKDFTIGTIKFRRISKAVNPFSFWRTIYLNPECHEASELRSILEHEQVHVKQLHTFDVMLAEISTIFYWFNPGVWLMKKAIKANLEFITDQEVIKSGIDSKQYQYALLKSQVLPQNQMPVNNFHFLTIKKRIAMINKKPSNRINLSNYLLLLPAIMILVLITGISKADFTSKSVVDAITDLPVTPLTQIFPDETEADPSVTKNEATGVDAMTVNNGEQKTFVMPPAMDTIKKDSVKNISGFRIKVNEADSPLNSVLKIVGKTSLSPEPLYVIDGEPMPKGILNLNPENIETIHVIKGEGATSLYGEDGKNGVIDIRTKKLGLGQSSDSSKPRTVIGYAYNQNQNISLSDIDNQLIILDGKEISKSDLDELKVSSIGTINLLKGEYAVNKYGEKGKMGVVVITTKSN